MQELLATRIPIKRMRLIQRPGQDLEVHGLLQELLASSVLLMENWEH